MARQAERKEDTRQRMLVAASRGFRSQGFAGIGVDAIAKQAGATSGAFYAHLGSKNGAFKAALELGLNEVIAAIPQFQKEHGAKWVAAFADYYLGAAHRNDLETGCAMTTLSPEVARAGPELHAAYEAQMTQIADLIARGLDGRTAGARRSKAWALLGVLIGGLTTARAVASPELAEEIAQAARRAAITVVS